MLDKLSPWLATARAAYSRPLVVIVAAPLLFLWALSGTYVLLVSQWLPPTLGKQAPRAFDIISWVVNLLTPTAWAMTLLLFLAAVAVEYAARQGKRGRGAAEDKMQIGGASSVDNEFRIVADRNPNLGRMLGPSQAIAAYQAKHEHAMVIWDRASILALPSGPKRQSRRVLRVPDDSWEPLLSENEVRKRLGIPSDKFPPYAGVAKHWLKDRKRWEWIGCREWHCILVYAHLQKFEKGMAIGPFRYEQHGDNFGQMFVVYDDLREDWLNSPALATHAPACMAPPQVDDQAKPY